MVDIRLVRQSLSRMVNTFLTSWDVDECARSLDYRRLGKQRVEAYQIWRAINGVTKGWRNHPASRSWEGYSCALAMYTNAMIKEWIRRGYNNTMKFLPRCKNPKMPWWWGLEDVRLSHCAALNRKNPDFYHFDLDGYVDNGYVWPSKIM